MWWNHGMGWGWGMGAGWIVMLLLTVGLVLVVAWLVRLAVTGRTGLTGVGRPGPTDSTHSPTPSKSEAPAEPLRILDERLARGEIDEETYQRTRRLLTEGH